MYIELLTVNDKMARSFVCGDKVNNGAFVTVDGLATLSRYEGVSLTGETYKVKKLVDAEGELFGIVAPDGHRHDERLMSGDIPEVDANKVVRGYFLSKGDVIRVEVGLVDGAVAVGDKLAPKADSFLLKKAVDKTYAVSGATATVAGSMNILGKVLAKEKYMGKDTIVILFV